jgi:predicted TIM-barrel fold metal-dependent hydrolase
MPGKSGTVDMAEAIGRAEPRGPRKVDARIGKLREPTPSVRKYLLVSVDDHVLEPPTLFQGRMPRQFADRAPRVERVDDEDIWVFDDGLRSPVSAGDGYITWEPGSRDDIGVTYDDLRPGVWDVHDRVKDMDLGGVYASLNFPSIAFGFAGQVFQRMKDPDLGLASMRAYNDWMIDEWVGSYPDRFIPCQVAWLRDAEIAASEIRKNAERGFTSVAFTENPEMLGLPSLHTQYWRPFLEACAETETIINLHIGSSSHIYVPSTDSPLQVVGTLIPVINGMASCLDWMYSWVPREIPDIKFVISEGGLGWVPLLIDRFYFHFHEFQQPSGAKAEKISDRDLLCRNFYFATYYDPKALNYRHDIGIDHIMLEADYPHGDSSWPDTQRLIDEQICLYPQEDIDLLTHRNACALYRHPLPDDATKWLSE